MRDMGCVKERDMPHFCDAKSEEMQVDVENRPRMVQALVQHKGVSRAVRPPQ